jgi:IS5 family transposase
LPYCTIYSLHTDQNLETVYADKGYFGEPNRDFLKLNHIEGGIMRKDTTAAKLTEYEKQRNKTISKNRYIVEQYFGLSRLYDRAKRAWFTTIIKNIIDTMFRQAAFNMTRGARLLGFT